MFPSLPTPELSIDHLAIYPFSSYCAAPDFQMVCSPENYDIIHIFGFEETSNCIIRLTNNSTVLAAKSVADSSATETTYAMKISGNKKRILTEYENRQKLPDSVFLIKVYDVYLHDRLAVMQLELCNSDISKKKLSEKQCWKLLYDIGNAISIIHSLGFIHLDVSPTNILIKNNIGITDDDNNHNSSTNTKNNDDCNGNFVLSDFGTLISDGEFSVGCEGSGPYASPEVLMEPQNVSYASDIFSFGVTLLEASTGSFAPRGGNDVYSKLRRGELRIGNGDKFAYKCDYSEHFLRLANAMLEPDPVKRPTACDIVGIASYYMMK